MNIPFFNLVRNFDRRLRVDGTMFLSYDDIDWNKTVAYVVGSTGSFGLIYLNRKGREPNGIVRDGSEFEKLRNRIKADMKRLKDDESKDRIVDIVYKKEDIYLSKFLDEAPDLIVQWKKLKYVTFPFFSGSGKIITKSPPTRSGSHRMNGIFIAKGPYIEEGKRIENVKIIDLAPLILHMFKIPIPRDVDSRVLKEIFKENSPPAKRNIVYQDVSAYEDVIKLRTVVSKEDEQKILERLKSLGYVD